MLNEGAGVVIKNEVSGEGEATLDYSIWLTEEECEWDFESTCLIMDGEDGVVTLTPYALNTPWTIDCWTLTPLG